jgi:hypothetical protein
MKLTVANRYFVEKLKIVLKYKEVIVDISFLQTTLLSDKTYTISQLADTTVLFSDSHESNNKFLFFCFEFFFYFVYSVFCIYSSFVPSLSYFCSSLSTAAIG